MSNKIDLDMLKKQMMETERELEKERRILDDIAEGALKQGKNLGQSPEAMRQSDVVGKLVLEELELRKMLAEYDVNEASLEEK